MTTAPKASSPETLDERLSALSPAKRAFVEAAMRARDGARTEATIPRRSTATAPVSFAQELLWRFERSLPGTSTYNVPRAFRVAGTLDVARLGDALDALVARHEILRTVFESAGDDVPRQIVRPACHAPLTVVDLSDVGHDQDALAQDVLLHAATTSFDLSTDLLLRATLVRLAPDMHLLMLVSHHIASDGASGDVLLRDLAAFYAGTPPLPLPLQYGDFAEWQRRELTPSRVEALLAHWRGRQAGAPVLLDLPMNRARPVIPTFQGRRCAMMLPKSVADAVATASAARGATPFMFLLACAHALLARYTRQDDITIGTVLTRRERTELEPLIGYFSNVLPARVAVDAATTFGELLARVRDESLDLSEHADLPYELLAMQLRDAPAASGAPLLQVLFSMLPADATIPSLGSAMLTALQLDRGIAKFDLTFAAGVTADGLRLVIEYAADLFDAETVERMLDHYARLIEGAAMRTDLPIAELPLLGDTERDLVLRGWNATEFELPAEATLASLLGEQAARTPNAEAVVCGGAALTYAELHQRATTLARYLVDHGVRPGDLVGVCMERSLELVIALVGIITAGAAYVPLDPELPADRLSFMVSDANVAILLTQTHLRGVIGNDASLVVALDTEWPAIESTPTSVTVSPPRPDDLAYMIYTSGSTGRPKGALNTHRGIVNRLLWMQREYTLTSNDVVLQKTPFSFDVSVWEFFWPLLTGARLVVAMPNGHRDPAYLVSTIREHGVTVMHFVPSMLRAFLDADGVARCTSLRDVICSGEVLPFELQQRFFARLSANLHNLYGPTEAAIDVTYWRCVRDDVRHVVPIGRPVANTRMYVLDALMQPVPIGIPGELHIGGVQVGKGYHNRPELTAERFVADPFVRHDGARLYKTGDLARWLSDGALEYLGRLDRQVKVRGFRIELGEIEAVLAEHPMIGESAVTIAPGADGDPMVVAYYVPRSSADVTTAELRTHVRRTLPPYMVPGTFVRMAALPLTPNGKLDRDALPPPAHTDDRRQFVPPVTPLEHELAAIWQSLLHVERIGLEDDFFDCGGNSLLAIRLVSRVRDATGAVLTIRAIFDAPVLGEFANRVSTALTMAAGESVMQDLLGELSEMSDAEAAQLLAAEHDA